VIKVLLLLKPLQIPPLKKPPLSLSLSLLLLLFLLLLLPGNNYSERNKRIRV
jgi:hypothetical protein